MTICLFRRHGEVFEPDDAAEVGVDLGEDFGFLRAGDSVVRARRAEGEGAVIGGCGGDPAGFAE